MHCLQLKKVALFGAAFFLLGAGCTSPDRFGGSRQRVADWSNERGFSSQIIRSGSFDLLALVRNAGINPILTVYVEGDGAPWLSAYHPPHDPTPVKPTALALAAADPAPAVVYLGRPCQYLDASGLANCSPRWWTTHRFAPEVVAAYDQALDVLKAPPYDDFLAMQDLDYVSGKLDISKESFIELMNGENKSFRDYKNSEKLLKLAIRFAMLVGIEKRNFR